MTMFVSSHSCEKHVSVGGTQDGGTYEAIYACAICHEGHRGAYEALYVPHGFVIRDQQAKSSRLA